MSAPYSVRLGTVTVLTGATGTIGTVPSGKRWIVRELIISQTGGGSSAARVVIGGVGGWIRYTAVLTQNQIDTAFDRHIVLNAGETLSLTSVTPTGTVALTCQAHGYELDAP